MFGGWWREILFVCGFAVFLWYATPPENLPDAFRRPLPPPQPPRSDLSPPPVPRAEAPPPLPSSEPRVIVKRLPPASPADPVVDVAAKAQRTGDSIGTAFVIGEGSWATARHVVQDCAQLYVNIGGRWVPGSEIIMHRSADVAVVRTRVNGGGLFAVSARKLTKPQDGYHIGYPHGTPAGVHSRLLGRVRVRMPGAPAAEPGLMWTEVERVPEFEGTLGGISGGPVVDETGGLVGVTIAASPRRGRVTTAAVESLRDVAPRLRDAAASAGPVIDQERFAEIARHARTADSVTMAYCQAEPGRPPPRRRRLPG